MEAPVDLAFCQSLPKVELHAHLHGSVRDATLLELAQRDGASTSVLREMRVELGEERTLQQCFRLFDSIHRLVRSLDVVTRIAREAVEDFAADNVRYVEFRTTPRPASRAREYVEAVIRGFEAALSRGAKTTPRLLLSVNRARPVSDAWATLAVAKAFRRQNRYVVGLDFSGDPHSKPFSAFRDVFTAARAAGLQCAIHCAEIPRPKDTADILDFKPKRIGHGLCLLPEHAHSIRNTKPHSAVEICPTSNIRTLRLQRYDQHPTLGMWLRAGHPVCICTDDSGVFATTLSRELWHVARAFGLSRTETARLAINAISCAFMKPSDVHAWRRKLEAALPVPFSQRSRL